MSQYNKLYTPEDSAVVFIDHQPQMTFGVASIERASLINNVTPLAKVAKEFGVPAVLTAVETEVFQRIRLAAASRRVSGSTGRRAYFDEFLGRSRLSHSHRGHRQKEHPHDRTLDGSLRDLANHRDAWRWLQHLRRRGLLRRDFAGSPRSRSCPAWCKPVRCA